jgi:toxin ParE1/3/4
MARLTIRRRADDDIDAIARFIARDNLDAGMRFYDAVAHDLLLLAENPGIGARRTVREPKLKDLRSWPVSGYRNYLVFYLAMGDGIDVVRVFHGARDIDRLIVRSV